MIEILIRFFLALCAWVIVNGLVAYYGIYVHPFLMIVIALIVCWIIPLTVKFLIRVGIALSIWLVIGWFLGSTIDPLWVLLAAVVIAWRVPLKERQRGCK